MSNFRLDKYPVTVGRFRQFVTAFGGGTATPAAAAGKHVHLNGGQGLASGASTTMFEPGWVASDDSNLSPTSVGCDAAFATWTGGDDHRPISCENWWEAYAFCIWDGGFLPSESEWEYASAGGSQEREFTWGETDPGMANAYAIYGCFYPSGLGTCSGVANIAPVGTATSGAGLWGQLDMGGEVWEWNLDLQAGFPLPCTDCANITAGTQRGIRGGDFSNTTPGTSLMLASNRNGIVPTMRATNVGFRCARTP